MLFGDNVVFGGSAGATVTALEFTMFAKYRLLREFIERFANVSVPAVADTIFNVKLCGVRLIVAAPSPYGYEFVRGEERVIVPAIEFTSAITASSCFVPLSM